MFSKDEIIEILKDDTKNEWLFEFADKVRKENVGDGVHLRALIEFSNICKNNCLYCGLRCENKNVSRYKMSQEEIIKTAKTAQEQGFKTVVLQSGEGEFYKIAELKKTIEEIKKFDLAVTLSIGEKKFEEYQELRNAGADRFLIRIETTNKNLYQKFHPKMDFEKRVQALKDIKNLGFEMGTGILVGLEGQTIEDLANDILFINKLEPEMIGLGPFIAHKDTPLKNAPNGNLILSLKVMAICRIMNKFANIPATTAMESLAKNGREMALRAGANVIMLNLTPKKYSENYEIYPNKTSLNEIEIAKKLLEKIGRYQAEGYGFYKNKI